MGAQSYKAMRVRRARALPCEKSARDTAVCITHMSGREICAYVSDGEVYRTCVCVCVTQSGRWVLGGWKIKDSVKGF